MKRKSTDLADLVAATIMKAPCTVKEVCLALGVSERRSDKAMLYIRAFKDQRLVYVSGYSTRRRPIYAWQPEPGRYSDAQHPGPKDPEYSERRRLIAIPPMVRVNSVFSLGAQ